MKKKIMVLLLAAGAFTIYGQEGIGNITIKGEGFRNDKGDAYVVIYKKGDDIKKDVNKIETVIKDGECRVNLNNIVYGEYAVKIVHDENKNGKMDMGLFVTEGIGVSKNIKLSGLPKFDEVKVEINDSRKDITIKMQYPTVLDFVAGGMKHGG